VRSAEVRSAGVRGALTQVRDQVDFDQDVSGEAGRLNRGAGWCGGGEI